MAIRADGRIAHTFHLLPTELAKLEAHRVRLGLRSHAETVRALIRDDRPYANLVEMQRADIFQANARQLSDYAPVQIGPVKPKPGALSKKGKGL